ncbi:MAG TPA: alpha-L-fucosidase, partial [Pedobacter sp.]|nr:alpha-L-fucosidase [Pedobacter sp.]
KMMGDYEQGWERKLPADIEVLNGRDWDCVMTIPPNQWGYNSDWKSSYIKTAHDLTDMLLHAVSMNGNLVINFGPDGKGNIRPEESNTAAKLGEWTKVNGEAIYGAKYSGLPKPDYGYYTKKANKLFLTVINKPVNGTLRLAIPRSYKQKPANAVLLVGNIKLNITTVDMGMSGDGDVYYDIQLPANLNATSPFVVSIELINATGRGNNFGEAKT